MVAFEDATIFKDTRQPTIILLKHDVLANMLPILFAYCSLSIKHRQRLFNKVNAYSYVPIRHHITLFHLSLFLITLFTDYNLTRAPKYYIINEFIKLFAWLSCGQDLDTLVMCSATFVCKEGLTSNDRFGLFRYPYCFETIQHL